MTLEISDSPSNRANDRLIKKRLLPRFRRSARAPQGRDHFPLRREGTFRLRLLLRFINVPQGELRPRHQCRFPELLLQLVRRVIHRAPAFLMRPAPNAPKWFAAVEMIRLAIDQDWLHKATKEIAKHWRNKRARSEALRA